MSSHSGTDARAGQIVEAEIDYVMANDVTAPLAFQEFEALGCEPMREKIVLIPDHFVPNKDVASAEQAAEMRRFVQKYETPELFRGRTGRGVPSGHGRRGVRRSRPTDRRAPTPTPAPTAGINAFSTGIGSTEAAACFAEGRLWFKVPEAINVRLAGKFNKMVSGKDLIIKIITDIGVDGANYKAFEFSGAGVANVPVSDRLTVSNMAIEAGGKAGIFPCDASHRGVPQGPGAGHLHAGGGGPRGALLEDPGVRSGGTRLHGGDAPSAQQREGGQRGRRDHRPGVPGLLHQRPHRGPPGRGPGDQGEEGAPGRAHDRRPRLHPGVPAGHGARASWPSS